MSGRIRAGGVQRGESLELLEGFAAFSIDSDSWAANIQIEGPAALVVASDELPVLRHGKVLVDVSDRTKSPLSISLPYAEVNLTPGSQVGVGAFGGVCEVHVFRGMASVSSLWDAVPRLEMGTDRTRVVAEGASIAIQAEQSGVLSTKEGRANRGMFDAGTLMDGGRLVVTNSYVQQVLDSKPLAYWRFEDAVAGMVRNSVGDRYHLHVHGDVQFDGLVGNRFVSFPLEDSADHARFLATDEPISSDLPGEYSVELWVNPSHYHTCTLLAFLIPELGKTDPSTTWTGNPVSHHGLLVELGGFSGLRDLMRPRKVRFVHRSVADCGGGATAFSEQAYSVRDWQHLACVKNSESICIYVNGKLTSVEPYQEGLPKGLIAVIGQISDSRFERAFYGGLDELAIYDFALSQGTIKEHVKAVQFVGLPGGESSTTGPEKVGI